MKPPRALRWALRLLLDREDRREVESDLEELYELRRQRDGERAARAWLARQWAQYPPRLLLAASRRPAEPRPGGPRPHPDRSRLERGEPMENLWTDLRLSLRSLSRSPGLALTIVLTVGLGIGATTTLGSLVHTVLLKPLPYPEPGRLVRIYTDSPPHRFPFSVADYLALAEQQTRFEAVAGYTNTSQAFTRDDVAERISGKLVTGGYFSLLGVRPAAGRLLGPEDDRPGAEPVVVVSGRFARRYLGGAEAAVGQAVRLNGTDYRVAGVLPARVGPFEQDRDFFAPARWQTPPRKGPFFITALGRLRSEGDREAAAAELRAINQRIFPLWRTSYQDDKASWAALDLKESVIGDVATRLLLVLGAVAFVLLIASTNASNLLLARAAQRRRELALRDALGASRGRLVQLQLAESALLSLGAAALGLALAAGGAWLTVHAGAGYLPRAHEIALSPPVLAFWAALTLGSAALFGLVPALAGARSRRGGALGAGGRSSTGGPATRRLRQALVAAQFAVATPLLIGSGLLLASLRQLEQVDPGFNPKGLVSAALLLPAERYGDPARIQGFWDRLKSELETLPGVAGVAFADGRPPRGVGNINNFDLEDRPTPAGESQPTAPWVSVSPEYFAQMGIPLFAGRSFDSREAAPDAPEVVVVDRAWAERYFPGQNPLGKRLHEGGSSSWTTVVGVVGEVKYLGLDQPDQGTVYWPIVQRSPRSPMERFSSRFAYFFVRTAAEPRALLPAVRQVVRRLDPALPLEETATQDELLRDAVEVPRLLSTLVLGFALVALLLSVVGIYGVMSYFVQQHTREIGIRLALGGRPQAVRRLVVSRGLQVVALGVALGLVAALALSGLLASLLFQVEPTDPRTFLVVATALLTAAFLACLLPARKAAAVDPATTLRAE